MSTIEHLEQRMRNLTKANVSRLARSEIRRKLEQRKTTIEEALEEDCCQSMTIYALLTAQRGWGHMRATKVAARMQINPTRHVRNLSDRQRLELVAIAQKVATQG